MNVLVRLDIPNRWPDSVAEALAVQEWIVRHYYGPGQWWPADNGIRLTNPDTMKIERYRFRGNRIPTPWTIPTQAA
ncbi:MAG TPA: hypothetical protein VFX70_13000 [Mycobacteriales bacterium]|nr:hypothetical protein [Mycobacteriales bacterium]